MPEELMEIDDDLFASRPLDPNGDLIVAVYSRQRLADWLWRMIQEDDEGDTSDLEENYRRQCLLIETGYDEFVSDEDYFYDVVDGINKIARYSGRNCVVGSRVMSWIEFRASTTRDMTQFTTFAEFRDGIRRHLENSPHSLN
jgi:hypothetical protein